MFNSSFLVLVWWNVKKVSGIGGVLVLGWFFVD